MLVDVSLKFLTIFSIFHYTLGNVLGFGSRSSYTGIPNGRIIGGKEAEIHSAPFMVGILLQPFQGNQSFCGGVLISDLYVLTAAHCLIGQRNATLMFGSHNWKEKNEENRFDIEVDYGSFYTHEEVDIPEHLHDIGLIRLPTRIFGEDYIDYVTLPTLEDSRKSYVGHIGRTYGWGLTHDVPNPQVTDISEVLMYVDVSVISEEECREWYPRLKEGTLCTSGAGVKATCSGDSGGPLLVNNTLIALTAYGKHKCEQDAPSVYTSIFYYIDWIESHAHIKFDVTK